MSTYRTMASATHISSNVANVECHKQVRSWRLLRALMELLIPTCNCNFVQDSDHVTSKPRNSPRVSSLPTATPSSTITGTIFGYKKGKVKFCIQTSPSSASPMLLLELAVPTTILAREMRGGLLRIALECNSKSSDPFSLLEMPMWRMYCNGRRVGFAVRRRPSKTEMQVLSKMRSVVVGAGVIEGKEIGCEEDDVMYLRGNFERIRGSYDAESFHLVDPDGSINQDLSIFFLRSR